jgi:hypothetical protein
MNKKQPPQLPNYLKKLLEVYSAHGLTPGLYTLEVYHDADCAIWKGGTCDCDPDLELVTKDGHAKHRR